MQAFEIPVKLSDGKLEIPEAILRQLPTNRPMRAILLIETEADRTVDADWERLTGEQFLAGYSEKDAIYDSL